MIRKQQMHYSEEILKEKPSLCSYDGVSPNERQDLKLDATPKLGKRAAIAAIKEWGQPKSKITHIIVNSTSGAETSGADYQLIHSLRLKKSVKRVMLYHQGCFAGGAVLRIAKDLAESNPGSRVLIVCSELTVPTFRGPSEDDMASLANGAASIIIGANVPNEGSAKTPLFRIILASQDIIPNSKQSIGGHLCEVGLTIQLSPEVPKQLSNNIDPCLEEAFSPLGISDWNSLFWAAHPGGAPILKPIESKVGLKKKLRDTWHVWKEYENMSSATVFFKVDEMRKRSLEEKKSTTGEGLKRGVLFGFGPGITVDTALLLRRLCHRKCIIIIMN